MSTLKNSLSEFFIFKGARPLLGFVLTCLVLSAALGSFLPKLMTELAGNYSDTEKFESSLYTLMIYFILVYLNRVAYQLGINRYVLKLVQKVRTDVYEKWLLAFEVQAKEKGKDNYPQGEVMARIMSDTMAIRELMTSGTFGILIDIFFVLACLISLIQINSLSGIFLAVTEVGVAILLVWGGKYMRKVFHDVRQSRGMVSQSVANVVGGLGEAYFTKHENYASKTSTVQFKDFLYKQLKANIWDASYYSIAESLYPLLLALMVFIFPYSKITEAAVIFAIVDLIQRSISPIKNIAGKITNIQRAITGIHRINEFTADLALSPRSPKGQVYSPFTMERLSVEIKEFQYNTKTSEDDRPFKISNVKFEGKTGELIGLVGLSGCGKSTVLNILAANIIPEMAKIELVSPIEENLTFPGASLDDVVHYRQQISLVSQDSHIFSESLHFNISLTDKLDPDFSKFWDWILEKIPYLKSWGIMPDESITPGSLSLGQNQLICGLRACYLKRPVVLFDEISSALDSELELALREVVLLVQEQSLTIIVAHRLETILEASCIIVMDNGEIVGSGTHKELLSTVAQYQKFMDEMTS
jgi:ABC-type multidrug transport system fused ATPase/permease subunit